MDTSNSKEGSTPVEERVELKFWITKSFLDKINRFKEKHGLPNEWYVMECAMQTLLQMEENPTITLSFLMNGQLRIEQRVIHMET